MNNHGIPASKEFAKAPVEPLKGIAAHVANLSGKVEEQLDILRENLIGDGRALLCDGEGVDMSPNTSLEFQLIKTRETLLRVTELFETTLDRIR